MHAGFYCRIFVVHVYVWIVKLHLLVSFCTFFLQANPPQLHSNLLYIQRYRRESKLIGEAAYFFTNIFSAESFISNIDAKSISMDEAEFEKNMESARARISGLGSQSYQTGHGAAPPPRDESTVHKIQMLNPKRENTLFQSKSSDSLSGINEISNSNSEIPMKKAESISDLENKGATLLKDSEASKIFQEYPYIFASAGDLRIGDVEGLLNNYKQLVFKYVCLSKGLGDATSVAPSSSPLQVSSGFDTFKESENHTMSSSDVQMKRETDSSVDDLIRALQGEGEDVDKLSDVKQEEYSAMLVHEKDEERDPKVLGEADAKDIDLMKQSPESEDENVGSKHPIAEASE